MRKLNYALLTLSLLTAPILFSGCAVGGGRETAGQYAHDKEIGARIKTDLYRDPVVKGTQVEVNSLRGTVQLSGFVDNQAQKDRAGQIAASAPGVISVHNDLIVGAQPGTMPTGRY
jgi:hyperosmotically inducible periplasmic protein